VTGDGSLLLHTSMSAGCLMPHQVHAGQTGQLQASNHRHPPMPQQCKEPHEQFSLMPFDDETDENRPPWPSSFNTCLSMPASLTEHVRQQAKARIPRVKVVRKAAVNAARIQTASLDFDGVSQPARQSGSEVSRPKGITAALQLSWPPPALMAPAVGLADTAVRASLTGV